MTFLLIINTTSSVNYEANKIYKLLNRVMILNNFGLFRKRFKTRNKSLMAYSSKIKVNTIQIISHNKLKSHNYFQIRRNLFNFLMSLLFFNFFFDSYCHLSKELV